MPNRSHRLLRKGFTLLLGLTVLSLLAGMPGGLRLGRAAAEAAPASVAVSASLPAVPEPSAETVPQIDLLQQDLPTTGLPPYLGSAPVRTLMDISEPSVTNTTAAHRPSTASALSGVLTGIQAELPDEGVLVVDLALDVIWGTLDADMLLTVSKDDGAYGAARSDGVGFVWTPLWLDTGLPGDVQGGVQHDVELDGVPFGFVTPRSAQGGVDVVSDRVMGQLEGVDPGTHVTITLGTWGYLGAGLPVVYGVLDADSEFDIPVTGYDCTPGTFAQIDYADEDFLVRQYLFPYGAGEAPVFIAENFAIVAGYADPATTVTVTVYEGDSETVRTGPLEVEAPGPHGFYMVQGAEFQVGDRIEVVTVDGSAETIAADLHDMTFDADADAVSGTGPAGGAVLLELQQFDEAAVEQLTATADAGDGSFGATFSLDLRPRDWVAVLVSDADGNATEIFGGPPFVSVYVDPLSEWDCVNGRVDGPGLSVTVSVTPPGGPTVTRENPLPVSDAGNTAGLGGACYLVWGPGWGPEDFPVGATVTLESPTWSGSVVVPEVTWSADFDADAVAGEAPQGELAVQVSQWEAGNYPVHGRATETVDVPPSGDFTAPFDGFDVRHAGRVDWTHYVSDTDFAVCNCNEADNLPFLHASTGWGAFGYVAVPGEGLTVSLYEADGTTLVAESSEDAIVDDPRAFWVMFYPEVTAGQWMTITTDSGWTTGLQVADVTLDVDLANSLVWGDAPKGLVDVAHYRSDGWTFSHFVPSDGYILDMDTFGHPLGPADDVEAMAPTLRNDRTGNYVHIPGSELWVETWFEGEVGVGGNARLGVRYGNDGDLDAPASTLTGSWEGLAYLSDTSGLSTSGTGPVVWQLGTVPAGDSREFYVFVEVTGGDGDEVTQTVEILSGDPDTDGGDPGRKTAQDSRTVNPGGTQMTVGKWSWTGDPAPGNPVVFTINVCNSGPIGSSTLTMRDDLGDGLSYDTWWAREPGWTELADPGTDDVALQYPSFPSWWCTEVYIRAIVDGSLRPGEDKVQNIATIAADNDENVDDNTAYWEGWLSTPYVNLAVDKYFSGGVLVPGGEIGYNLHVYNWGNTPVAGPIRVTDTLPSGVSFVRTEQWNGPEAVLVQNSGGILVWEIDGLENGHWIDMNIVVQIDPETDPDTVLVNTFEVQPQPEDTNPSDDSRTCTETVYPAGPNLRVRKSHESWTWDNERSLVYYLTFENVGDVPIYDVTLTDTLPEGVSWDGNGPDFWWDWSRLVSTDFVADEHLTWQFSVLYPGDSGTVRFRANPDDPDARLITYTNTAEITLPPDDQNPADNTAVDEQFSGGEVDWVNLDVYRTRIWGCGPEGPFTVISKDGQWDFSGNCIDENLGTGFMPGDEITVKAGTGSLPVVIKVPDPFTGFISSIDETVSGQIDSLDHEQVNVDLWGFPGRTTETDDHGHYSVTYTDIPQGAQGDVGYFTVIDYANVGFLHRLVNPDLTISVDYHDDWVNGNYEAGHTVWITATTAEGTVKAVVELETASLPEWGGQEGFQTHWEDWSPSQPDLVPGDWVYASVDTGRNTQVQIGQMDLTLDLDSDTVDGVINAPWAEPLDVSCEIHEENAPSIWVEDISPFGGTFTCDFTTVGFDIVPGTNVAIRYVEPDGDSVYNRPDNPAPWIRIEKWAEGSPAAGGHFTFHLRAINDGGMAAEGIMVFDTMTGFSYLDDTSGEAHTGSGSGPIVWELGTLEPYSSKEFAVYVSVDAAQDETVVNGAEISTTNPYNRSNPWDRYTEWSGTVQANDTHINIGKWAWTGDPAPGTDFVWVVNPCNWGSTDSAELAVTDTLPDAVSFVDWWSDDNGWTMSQPGPHQLMFSRLTLTAGRCSEIRIVVHVPDTVEIGTELANTATLDCDSDLETDDNTTWHSVWTNWPHANIRVDKWWNSGSLVPGGEIRFGIQVRNDGNLPLGPIYITDTLPAYATFEALWASDATGTHLVDPVTNDNGIVTWMILGLDNGFAQDFEMALRINADAPVDAELVNTVQVTPFPDEDRYEDNTSTVVEQIHAHGPNLRVRKWGDWHGDGDGHKAWFQVAVENIGDATVDSATLVDVLPHDMVLDGGVNTDWSRVADFETTPSGDGFTFELEDLHVGYRLDFSFNTWVTSDEGQVVAGGQWFTNTATITTPPDDVDAADNTVDFGLDTGPDLYISKTLADGVLKSGELITFSLVFGNEQRGHTWWWGTQGSVWVTDTLPSGLEFVSAQLRSWGWGEITPDYNDGTRVAWSVGQMNTGAQDELLITVRIADTVLPGVLTNLAEVASDQPMLDLEVDYADNADTVELAVALPIFEVSKTYVGNRVAGTPVTFTLTVANTGSANGTSVVLEDTFLDALHRWTISLIAAGATAQRTFSAQLPCTLATVTNSDYAVTDSAEGQVSEPGLPVNIDVIAPTIVPSFRQSATAVSIGATVYFSDTSTTNGRRIVAWSWNFGDGSSTVTTRTASHAYDEGGTFTVTLIVTDACGFSKSVQHTVTVAAGPEEYYIHLPVIVRKYP